MIGLYTWCGVEGARACPHTKGVYSAAASLGGAEPANLRFRKNPR